MTAGTKSALLAGLFLVPRIMPSLQHAADKYE